MNEILNSRYSENSEKSFQNLTINNKNIQKYIVDNLDIEYSNDIKFSKCGPYINRIIPDIKITKNNNILALIECKGANINVTDYVRGIGQLYQYEYFSENNYIEKNEQNLKYDQNFKTVFFFPSDVTRYNDFNITKFKYPSTTKILQINPKNYYVRDFSIEQQLKFSNVSENLIAISEYYFRDNRLLELYILLNHLKKYHLNKKVLLNRRSLEENELRQYGTPNNRNWRNAFITLSGLGLITSKNTISKAGLDILKNNYYKFCSIFFYSYIEPYAKEILPFLILKPDISLSELNSKIKNKNSSKDLLFVTESENRYLSSWLGIFRDDYGFIDYEPRNLNRKINYSPFDLTEDELIAKIKSFSKAPQISNYFNH